MLIFLPGLMSASDISPRIQPPDWNFDSIPDRHLIACCYWEYAREARFLRTFKSRCVAANRNPKPLAEAFELCGKDARLVMSIGSVANSFLLGFGFEPDDPKQPAGTRKLDAKEPVTGNFPAPWQSLSAPEQDYRADLAAGAFPVAGQPFQRASGADAVNALMFFTSTIVPSIPMLSPSTLNETLQRQLAQLNSHARAGDPLPSASASSPGVGHLPSAIDHSEADNLPSLSSEALAKEDAMCHLPSPGAVKKHSKSQNKAAPLPWPTPSIYRLDTHSRSADEIALVQIQWGSFTDEELIDSFRAWVKANRPDPIRPIPARGHKLRDWRANLTRLAVMRLLTRFSALQLLDPKADPVPGLWDSKQFSGPTWHDVVKWHDARREARAIFHQLFPFLRPGDDPISWPTGRSKS
jgi:hypothetical protein